MDCILKSDRVLIVKLHECMFMCISQQLMHVIRLAILSVRLSITPVYCVEMAKRRS